MSCTTLYLHRRADGVLLGGWEKYGALPWDSPEQVRAHLRQRTDRFAPVGSDAGWIDSVLCRGLLLDEVARIFRVYTCYGDAHRPQRLEARRRLLERALAWSGWDAGVALGAHQELATLAGVPFRPIPVPAPFGEAELAESLIHAALGPGAMNREAWTLRYPEEEQWESGAWGAATALTLVHPYGRSQEHLLHDTDPFACLLMGPPLAKALATADPWDPACEDGLRAGACIDLERRTLSVWCAERVPHGFERAVAAAWPGFTMEWDENLYAGQLARGGHAPTPYLLQPDPERKEEWEALARHTVTPWPGRRPLAVGFGE